MAMLLAPAGCWELRTNTNLLYMSTPKLDVPCQTRRLTLESAAMACQQSKRCSGIVRDTGLLCDTTGEAVKTMHFYNIRLGTVTLAHSKVASAWLPRRAPVDHESDGRPNASAMVHLCKDAPIGRVERLSSHTSNATHSGRPRHREEVSNAWVQRVGARARPAG